MLMDNVVDELETDVLYVNEYLLGSQQTVGAVEMNNRGYLYEVGNDPDKFPFTLTYPDKLEAERFVMVNAGI